MFLYKLDYLLERDGMNKHTLAALAGVPYTTIVGLYKKGYENIKLTTLKAIAAAFDVSIDFLVLDSITIDEYFKKRHEDEFIQKYRALDERGRETVDSVLEQQYQAMLRKKAEADFLPRQA